MKRITGFLYKLILITYLRKYYIFATNIENNKRLQKSVDFLTIQL